MDVPYNLLPPFSGPLTLHAHGKHLLWAITFQPQWRLLSFVLRGVFWLEPIPGKLVLRMLPFCLLVNHTVTLSSLSFLQHILPSVGMLSDLVKHTSVFERSVYTLQEERQLNLISRGLTSASSSAIDWFGDF